MKLPFTSFWAPKKHTTATPELKTGVLNVLSEGVLICDGMQGSHSIFYANPAFLKFYQHQDRPVIGHSLHDFFSSRLTQQHLDKLISLAGKGSKANIELEVKSNADTRWLEATIEPMRDNEGKLNYLVITQRDITNIKHAETALKKSNDKLQNLIEEKNHRTNEHEQQVGVMFEQSSDTMILLNSNNQIVDANDSALTFFQSERCELIGNTIETYIEPMQADAISQQLSQVPLYQEIFFDRELTLASHLERKSMFAACRYISLKNERFIVVTLKYSRSEQKTRLELKRRKNELLKVVSSLNLATQAGGIGIWSWDFATNKLIWDERMYEMYDVDPNICNNTYLMWRERVHPDDLFDSEQALLLAREGLRQFNADFRIVIPSGETRWIKAAAHVVFASDGQTPTGMSGVNIDISKEKQSQLYLKKESEAAQAASEAKSMFLANMSHEIRTPMNGVIGMIGVLSETELRPEQRTMVSTIEQSAITLLHIINDILDFSKIEAGRMSLESRPVELLDLLERTLDVLSLQAQNKGNNLFLTYDSQLPHTIMSDSVRLSQIMLNLVGNAVKFTQSVNGIKGKIWVSASLGHNGVAPCIDLIVEDNGIGISEEQKGRLFNAFTQADPTTTRLYGGTGLGLSITHSLLEMMGGTIQVESQQGIGSRFSLELPFIQVESPLQDSTYHLIDGSRVLIITKNQDVATFCEINLSNCNCKIHTIPTLKNAITVLNQAKQAGVRIDLLIIGPDYYNFFDNNQLNDEDTATLVSFDIITLSAHNKAKTCLSRPNLYTMPSNPFKPSELMRAIRALKSPGTDAYASNQGVRMAKPNYQASNIRILVVDDQPTNRDVFQRQLNYLGFQCDIASNGQQALDIWRAHQFDLLLVDCHMPVMDGYELTRQIRTIERNEHFHSRTPIIAITADVTVDAAKQCIDSGMDDYLAKPVELSQLNQSLMTWLEISMPVPSAEQPNAVKSESDSPISMRALQDILGTTDHAVIAPLLQDYWSSVVDDLRKAESALDNQELNQLQHLAHAAKGAARTAGAQTIADTFETLQHNATTKDWNTLNKTIKRCRQDVDALGMLLIELNIIEPTEA